MESIEKITPEECAKYLDKSPNFVRLGLQQRVFPWGYAVKTTDTHYDYFINRKKFMEIEGFERRDK